MTLVSQPFGPKPPVFLSALRASGPSAEMPPDWSWNCAGGRGGPEPGVGLVPGTMSTTPGMPAPGPGVGAAPMPPPIGRSIRPPAPSSAAPPTIPSASAPRLDAPTSNAPLPMAAVVAASAPPPSSQPFAPNAPEPPRIAVPASPVPAIPDNADGLGDVVLEVPPICDPTPSAMFAK